MNFYRENSIENVTFYTIKFLTNTGGIRLINISVPTIKKAYKIAIERTLKIPYCKKIIAIMLGYTNNIDDKFFLNIQDND